MSAEPSDGEELLQRYHTRFTGATSFTFSDARDEAGRSSYEWLVDDVATADAERILDLACGDGYLLERLIAPGRSLTGIDMSAAELAAARRRLDDAATLVEGYASVLPFEGGSFDAVVSHLALMLMERLDEVFSDVRRVLAPNGWFFAVSGGVATEQPAAPLRLFRETWLATVKSSGYAFPAFGDERAANAETLTALLTTCGFGEIVIEQRMLRRPGSASEIADHYGLFYPPASLPEDERAAFVRALTDALADVERAGEPLAFVASALHIRARRAV